MTDKTLYKLHADVCKALAHSIRIEIIDTLKSNELSFGEILKKSGIAKSSLSQHLTVMVNKGLLVNRKEGLHVYYRLASGKVYDAFRIMREVLRDRVRNEKNIYSRLKFG